MSQRASGPTAAAPGRPGTGGGFAFRPDVEGLRGIATLLVLLFHADVAFLGGGYVGLDVFFVISGFLITGLLLRELERTDRVSLGDFYARRVRRLLPSIVAVLAFVVAAGWVLMSPLARDRLAGDVIAANFYFVNWRFASQEGDYLTRGLDASPVQHFWSLSVEEQFYLVWPVILVAVGVAWLARTGRSPRPVLGGLVLVAGVALLAHSIERTHADAGPAYFSTLTRGWEFLVGAAVALVPAARMRMPRPLAAALVVGGLAALAWSAVTYDDTTAFPGPAALVPCIASAVIIVAGASAVGSVPGRLMEVRPARWVGRISYSWYLWHWPLLVFAAIAVGELSTPAKLAIVAGSVVPAWLAHRYVEEPFRRSPRLARSPARTFRFGLACTVAVGVLGAACWATSPSVPIAAASDTLGARALQLDATPQARADAIRPNPKTAIRDRGRADADGCLVDQEDTRSGRCVYGDRTSRTTAVLFGDSHAMQYFPALDLIAQRRGWRLVVLTKSGCTPADVVMWSERFRRAYRECGRWRTATLRRIARERPALIVVGNLNTHRVVRDGRRLDRADSARALASGMTRTLRTLRATGAPVALVTDNPRPDGDPRDCVSRSFPNLRDCAFARRDAFRHAPVNARAARRVAGVRAINPTPLFCPGRLCPAVIGDVLVYRNTAHITATYMESAAPWIERRLPAPARR